MRCAAEGDGSRNYFYGEMGSSDVAEERRDAKSFTSMEKDGRGRTTVVSNPIPKEPIPWVESIHLLV